MVFVYVTMTFGAINPPSQKWYISDYSKPFIYISLIIFYVLLGQAYQRKYIQQCVHVFMCPSVNLGWMWYIHGCTVFVAHAQNIASTASLQILDGQERASDKGNSKGVDNKRLRKELNNACEAVAWPFRQWMRLTRQRQPGSQCLVYSTRWWLLLTQSLFYAWSMACANSYVVWATRILIAMLELYRRYQK